MRYALLATVVLVLAVGGCGTEEPEHRLGATYEEVARPEVWRVLPRGQAEAVGIKPGDVLLLYNGQPVRSNDEVRRAQAQSFDADEIPVVLLRDDGSGSDVEVEVKVRPGPLGVMPAAARYPSSLALALTDLLRFRGRFADYDWLAALSGEAFTFTANDEVCRAWWPGGKSDAYLDEAVRIAGISLDRLRPGPKETVTDAIRGALLRNQPVLVRGGWPGFRADFWGVASRYDHDDSLVYGYSYDTAEELPLAGNVSEAFVMTGEDVPGFEPAQSLAAALRQVLQLNQARADSGWLSGIQAYDLLVKSLYEVPFCPLCGEGESQMCFDRIVWVTIAHRESAIRFLESMKLALPDRAAELTNLIAEQQAIVGKLEGISRSGISIGTREDQRKLAAVIAEIELIENDLIGDYEGLLAGL